MNNYDRKNSASKILTEMKNIIGSILLFIILKTCYCRYENELNIQGVYGEMKEVVAADSTKTYNMDNASFEKIKADILSLRGSIVN